MRKPKGNAGGKPASRVKKVSYKTRQRKVLAKHNASQGSSGRFVRLAAGKLQNKMNNIRQQSRNGKTESGKSVIKSKITASENRSVADKDLNSCDSEASNTGRRRSSRILTKKDTNVSEVYFILFGSFGINCYVYVSDIWVVGM